MLLDLWFFFLRLSHFPFNLTHLLLQILEELARVINKQTIESTVFTVCLRLYQYSAKLVFPHMPN